MGILYFDQAATSYHKPETVKQAVYDSFSILGNAGRGAHEPTLQAARLLYRTRDKIAQLFHAPDPSRVAFTANVTQALNTAIEGLIGPEDHVITTVCEHNSVLRPLYQKEKQGAELTFIQPDSEGMITAEDFEKNIRSNTKAFVCHHGSNVTGNVLDLQSIGRIAHEHGIITIIDAAQTAGNIPIDMEQMGIDVLCFTGHKGLMGPQGTGGLCVSEEIEIPSFLVGGSGIHSFLKEQPSDMPVVLEAGTLNGHGIAGLEAGLDFICETGIDTIHEKEWMLRKHFLDGLKRLEERYPEIIRIYGNPEREENTSIVTLNISDLDASYVSDCLWEDYGICVRAGAHCAPLMHTFYDTVEQGAVRFSFSYFNTLEEVDIAIKAIEEVMECEFETPM